MTTPVKGKIFWHLDQISELITQGEGLDSDEMGQVIEAIEKINELVAYYMEQVQTMGTQVPIVFYNQTFWTTFNIIEVQ